MKSCSGLSEMRCYKEVDIRWVGLLFEKKKRKKKKEFLFILRSSKKPKKEGKGRPGCWIVSSYIRGGEE